MILEEIGLKDPANLVKLRLSVNHKYDWEYYYMQYNSALIYVINVGDKCRNQINPRARAFMFLLRHTFELLLKYNLVSKSLEPPISHIFSDILAIGQMELIPEKIKEAIRLINRNDDGSCYKYFEDKNNVPFWYYERLEILEVLELYANCAPTSDFKIANNQILLDNKPSLLRCEFTLHMGECSNLGCLRTQYDDMIGLLLKGIYTNKISVNAIYLPLLFLIRHSLELALKFNIINIVSNLSDELIRTIKNEHSLCRLYNKYLTILDDKSSELPQTIRDEYDSYKVKYDELNKIIHSLDSNSLSFRFPFDKQGQASVISLKSDSLKEILELYSFTDPFITFTVYVMKDCGIIDGNIF